MLDATDTHDDGDVMAALADERRRAALAALADREPPVSLSELAAAVVDSEAGGPNAGDPSTDGGWTSDADAARRARLDDRERRVTVSLYHVHLPRLDDAGVVSFDPDSKEVDGWQLAELAPVLP